MYVNFICYQDFCLSSGNLFPILRSMRALQEVNSIFIKKLLLPKNALFLIGNLDRIFAAFYNILSN